jgi:Xaa-Pro aminopeptidase
MAMSLSRRHLLQLTAPLALGAIPRASSADEGEVPAPIAALRPRLDGVEPISLDERRARLARAQKLMAETGLDAIVVASGSSLDYFSGATWGLSERFFGMVLTREGDPAWVTPAFEKARALEQIQIGTDVRAWEEHESPSDLVASILRDRKVVGGRIGMEEQMPFAFAEGVGKAAPALNVDSATPVTAGCRMIKDAHEIALMRRACEITVAAHRAVFQSLKTGMTQGQVSGLSAEAHKRLGVRGGSLVLFGADAAFPHGTTKPQPLKAGDVVLIDGGCKLEGYSSDITRTGVFGATPTDRQRKVWDIVRQAQDAAFRTAKPGAECQAVDAAARKVVVDAGFGPDYKYFTHRLGHGIGLDGHEWTNFVRGNTTRIRPGMCFSDEPGIYIYGEMGIRHEDTIYIGENGAENMTKWTGSPEEPAVV